MSSPLTDGSVNTGDAIEAIHISQLFPIVAALEDNQTHFRADIGTTNAYKVDFSGSGGNPNQISAYQAGQLVVFKAASTNTGVATLQVAGPSGDLAARPLTKNGELALEPGDIQANQIVVAIYNDEGTGRFELVGVPSAADGTSFFFDDQGSADDYELDAAASGITAYASGMVFAFRADNANSGPVTLEVIGAGGGLGVKDVVKHGNQSLIAGDIDAGALVVVMYNGDADRFEMVNNPLPPEDGTHLYRDSGGILSIYEVDASGSGGNQRRISAYAKGQIFTFKANATNDGPATLEVIGPSGGLGARSIKKNGNDLVAGDIQDNHMVMVLYNDEGGGGFFELVTPTSGVSDLLFGDGSDGDDFISSDTEWFENKYYNNLTIDPGVKVCTNGHRLYVRGLLTVEGTIHNNGGDASPSSGSSVGAPGVGRYGGGVLWESDPGQSGSLQTGESVPSQYDKFNFYARGGDGGAGSYGSGGDAQNGNELISDRYYKSLSSMLSGLSENYAANFGPRAVKAATAGAGGSGDDNVAAGGSGGGAGGVLWIAARHLAGSGELQSKGGAGGDAGGTDAGGGGGGGGGIIYLLTADTSQPLTTSVDGGAGGAGGGGAGTNGGDGGSGLVIFRGGL